MKQPRKHHPWHMFPAGMRDCPPTGAICEFEGEWEALVDRVKHSSRRLWRDKLRVQNVEHSDDVD